MAKRDAEAAGKPANGFETASRQLFRADEERHQRPHRDDRGPDHVPDDGLHHLRQSADPRPKPAWTRARCSSRPASPPRCRPLVMGLYANYPIALAPGMGLNAFFAFTVVLGLQIHMAAGARRRVPVRRAVLPASRSSGLRAIHHQRHPAKPEIRDLRRRRLVPRHHRARASQARRRSSGDAGDARRHEEPGRDPVPARLRADRGAQLSARSSAAR